MSSVLLRGMAVKDVYMGMEGLEAMLERVGFECVVVVMGSSLE